MSKCCPTSPHPNAPGTNKRDASSPFCDAEVAGESRGSRRVGGGYSEAGGGGCRCAAWWWREARWEEIQQPIVWGGRKLTHEHQSGALHWSPDDQRGPKVSVFEETTLFELLTVRNGTQWKDKGQEDGYASAQFSRSHGSLSIRRRHWPTFASLTFKLNEMLVILCLCTGSYFWFGTQTSWILCTLPSNQS